MGKGGGGGGQRPAHLVLDQHDDVVERVGGPVGQLVQRVLHGAAEASREALHLPDFVYHQQVNVAAGEFVVLVSGAEHARVGVSEVSVLIRDNDTRLGE